MKKVLTACLCGAGLGGLLLLAAWLMNGERYPFADTTFVFGLLFFLIGLIFLTRAGKASSAPSGISSPRSAGAQMVFNTNAAVEEQKAMSDPKLKNRKRGVSQNYMGIALTLAGLVNLIAFGIACWLL